MKWLYSITLSLIVLCFYGCDKEEYFKSESGTQKELTGAWNLIPIPKYNPDGSLRVENWGFDNGKLNIQSNGTRITADYTINTSLTTVKVEVSNVSQRPEYYNGTWQVVKLNSKFLIIANDHGGSSGLTELEFTKGN